MKRLLLAPLAALAAVLLFSSCTYDPLYGAYYGSGYYGSGYYGGPSYAYSGGYYNGVYSDFYVGFHNDYYRYRHTRCSYCNYYPCRGGHVTHYHTYYRNYRKPLYQRAHRGHDHGHAYASHRGHRDGARRGDSYRHQGIFGEPRSRSSYSSSPARQSDPSSGYGTMRNSTPYPSSRSSGTPSRVRGSGSGTPSPRVSPHSVVSSPPRSAPSPQAAPRSAPVQVKSAPASSSGSQSSQSDGSSSSRSSAFSRNESKGPGRGASRAGRGR